MWLPTPAYERMPLIWFLFGLLFMADGLYLGLDVPISILHIVLGLICSAYGVGITVVRMNHRRDQSDGDRSDTAHQ